ncbi:MAG: glutathione peroxidase [Sphingomonadaceae bacterium]|nr:glutathione peroxidase [Sphingomonadaceae bacterium]
MATAIQDIPLKTIDGQDDSLAAHEGKVLLVVNVASKCGLTPQYEGLEALYRKYRGEGFEVLGFPANDFGGQEPGTEEEIQTFCTTKFDVDFPMFSKVVATGPDKHPLYKALTDAVPSAQTTGEDMRAKLKNYGMTPTEEPEVLWNFEKFLIGRDGDVVARFAPSTTPDDPALVGAIERELFASE